VEGIGGEFGFSIEEGEGGVELVVGDPQGGEIAGHGLAVTDAKLEGVGRKAEEFEEMDGCFDDLGVHLGNGVVVLAGKTDGVDVPLQELTESASLWAFGSEVWACSEPFAGFGELFGVGAVHAGEGGGELWTQGVGGGGGLLDLLDFFVGFA